MRELHLEEYALLRLEKLYEERKETLGELKKIYESSLPVLSSILSCNAGSEMEIDSLRKRLKDIDMRIADLIKREHLYHLQSALDKFEGHYPDSDRHVFVMMKFPEGNSKKRTQKDKILNAIFERIANVCHKRFGLTAVRADKLDASNIVWQNAQVHALGCSYGIAVLENKHTDEFNPNIAMEAGFMEGIGHRVLLLVEETFPHNRADIHGRISESFRWGDGKDELETIDKSVTKWFDNQKVARKPGSC
uniref:Uncharacterized protein n=1 Tax=Candidatus Kentrum sp. FM TaxID=2126340 RepID=A0A450VSF6_9GAMM|nr:MAG: hypothetical protein BECKFM1743C_GA0114222_100169 [Candidatus Kentron sp. FM]VFJ52137.1 MAG: hypothetical protein BECKFM1743A_GA0114220_100984 [Candidatus Kentron sp. FM]VFK07626.1 MAG: hypothetical protein BECKFM1743B_GA0114221_100465 [Candidatus Kentron sp. FM]